MEFQTLTLREESGALYVTINNPPINLMNGQMVMELMQVSGMLMQRQSDLKVVVLDSADPDFWIAHFDINELEASLEDPSTQSKYPDINAVQALGLSWQAVPQVTIGKVNGRARGGGLEFLLGLSMRFASETSLFGQPEADAEFLATGGGATRTFMMAGPARGMEILLSARDFSAAEYERYGLINRALPEDELDSYVDDLVERLVQRSTAVIAMHNAVEKSAMSPFVEPMFAAMAEENKGFRQALESGAISASIADMKALGQTREAELDLPATLAELKSRKM